MELGSFIKKKTIKMILKSQKKTVNGINPSINAQDFGRRHANSYTDWKKLHRHLSNLFREKLLRKYRAYDMCWFGCVVKLGLGLEENLT